MTVQELKKKIDADDAPTLIDVREAYENEEFNIGGMLIPMGELMQKAPELSLDKSTEIVMYCRSGNRSAMAQEIMKMNGFESVHNLDGGMIAWQEAFGDSNS